MILAGIAARIAGAPVKWIEDRLEHLSASVSATNRQTRIEAAVTADGRITALEWDQIEDCGAHLRAPEPATLYRMHGNMGAVEFNITSSSDGALGKLRHHLMASASAASGFLWFCSKWSV